MRLDKLEIVSMSQYRMHEEPVAPPPDFELQVWKTHAPPDSELPLSLAPSLQAP
eukprot:CAMPEP_0118960818 /NCGR_PEP_ID=MMETSP1169-20130426/63832_1 /TAXON_ID=36882 /ORGANISM="Pyramimonas obovata, Strain CCMP722" /LENGTH=53 /DNA_ID=CAMNT_0006908971 /DNA_START=630 /DNA_END=788 /DNA_ORIENTATION=+